MISIKKLSEECEKIGLCLEKKTEHHFQIKGGNFLVNVYPSKSKVYISKTNKGFREGNEERIAKMGYVLPDNRIPKSRNRKGNASAKRRLFKKQGGLCAICNEPMDFEEANVDHRIPFSLGGSDRADNKQLVHEKCNSEKGNSLEKGVPQSTLNQNNN